MSHTPRSREEIEKMTLDAVNEVVAAPRTCIATLLSLLITVNLDIRDLLSEPKMREAKEMEGLINKWGGNETLLQEIEAVNGQTDINVVNRLRERLGEVNRNDPSATEIFEAAKVRGLF